MDFLVSMRASDVVHTTHTRYRGPMKKQVPRIAIFCVLVFPSIGSAFDDPGLRIDTELGYACFADEKRYHGMHAAVDMAIPVGGAWSLRGGYAVGETRSRGLAFTSHHISIGLRVALDVFEYVPWADVSPTMTLSHGDRGPAPFGAGVSVGLGFDHLFSREWSLGFVSRFHQVSSSSRIPAHMILGVRMGYRWTMGDPFAP